MSRKLRGGSRPGTVGASASAFLLACVGLALALVVVAGAATPGPTPSFAAAKSYAIGNGAGAIGLADLNGDGKPDIASPHSNSSTVTVLLNRDRRPLRGSRHLRHRSAPLGTGAR